MSKLEELIKQLCPNGVKYKRLDEVFESFNGMTGVSNKWKENGNCQFIEYMNAYKNLKINIKLLPFATVKNLQQNTLQKGDILLTCASETPDECAVSSVIEDEIKDNVFLDDHLFGIRVKKDMKSEINTTFINYYMHTNNFRKKINKAVRGVTRFYISIDEFMKICIPVPPLEVQCKIVHILDDFTELSAELLAELLAELKARKNQYNYYLEKLLCNDKNAKIYKLKELCVFFNGDRGKNYPKVSEMVNKGVPFVNAGDVNRVIDYKNCNKITLEKYNSMNGAKLRKNDILYCLRGSTGKNGIYELDEGTVASSLVAIRVNSIINYKYLYYLLNSSLERRQRYKSDTGAAQPNLSVQSISNYEFPVPNMEEQNKIVNILDKFEKLCNDISQGLPAEIEARQKQYEYYRDKLLTFKELKVNE